VPPISVCSVPTRCATGSRQPDHSSFRSGAAWHQHAGSHRYDSHTWHSNLIPTAHRGRRCDQVRNRACGDRLPSCGARRVAASAHQGRDATSLRSAMNRNTQLSRSDQAYNKTSWHGTNLRGSLRRVTPAQAAWRPAEHRHNIWEIAVHAAYWKYAAARRFRGDARGSFPMKGSNWFRRPSNDDAGRPPEKAWKSDCNCLTRCTTRCAPRSCGCRRRTLP
jgi:hypothetical protein